MGYPHRFKVMPPSREDVAAWMWRSVMPEPNSGCWLWDGSVAPNGYGKIEMVEGRWYGAHRLSYIAYKGDVPDGLVIHHKCENRVCVNPDHLEAVTQEYNVLAADAMARQNKVKTHCVRGHELAGENLDRVTQLATSGKNRRCRICINIRAAEYRTRKSALVCK
ncbi:MAG: HNH endonuclease [Desulfurellales bacterium]|nr:MAG: HNH endonuclease [Desulfurellales bacterium]